MALFRLPDVIFAEQIQSTPNSNWNCFCPQFHPLQPISIVMCFSLSLSQSTINPAWKCAIRYVAFWSKQRLRTICSHYQVNTTNKLDKLNRDEMNILSLLLGSIYRTEVERPRGPSSTFDMDPHIKIIKLGGDLSKEVATKLLTKMMYLFNPPVACHTSWRGIPW